MTDRTQPNDRSRTTRSSAIARRRRSSADGFIDWLCWPRFDSGACFAALLGRPEHGRWLIAPRDSGARVRRRYLDRSLILVTTFETADGAVELIDFLPPRNDGADLVRLIRGVRGRVELRTEFILRFDCAFSVPWIEHLEDAGLRAVAGQATDSSSARLRTNRCSP